MDTRGQETHDTGLTTCIQVHLNKLECREKSFFSCNLFQKVKLSYI